MLSRMSNEVSERRGRASSAVARLAAGCGLRGWAGVRAPGLSGPSARAPRPDQYTPPQPPTRPPGPPLRRLRTACYALRATHYELRDALQNRAHRRHAIASHFFEPSVNFDGGQI